MNQYKNHGTGTTSREKESAFTGRLSGRLLALAALVLLAVQCASLPAVETNSSTTWPTPGTTTRVRTDEGYGRLLMSFEVNLGQQAGNVKYLSRGAGYALLLTPEEVVLVLSRGSGATEKRHAKRPLLPSEGVKSQGQAVLRSRDRSEARADQGGELPTCTVSIGTAGS